MANGHSLLLQPPRQIAYFVPDIREAASAHHAAFGSGPFLVLEHVSLASSLHRGRPVTHDHSSAYGHWGTLMVEFVQQHGDDPSAFHDQYPVTSGQYGLHHIALFTDDLDADIAEYEANGMPLAQISQTETGTRYAFIDAAAQYGHMLELYEPSEALTGFYAMVHQAAQDWDGSNLLRQLG